MQAGGCAAIAVRRPAPQAAAAASSRRRACSCMHRHPSLAAHSTVQLSAAQRSTARRTDEQGGAAVDDAAGYALAQHGNGPHRLRPQHRSVFGVLEPTFAFYILDPRPSICCHLRRCAGCRRLPRRACTARSSADQPAPALQVTAQRAAANTLWLCTVGCISMPCTACQQDTTAGAVPGHGPAAMLRAVCQQHRGRTEPFFHSLAAALPCIFCRPPKRLWPAQPRASGSSKASSRFSYRPASSAGCLSGCGLHGWAVRVCMSKLGSGFRAQGSLPCVLCRPPRRLWPAQPGLQRLGVGMSAATLRVGNGMSRPHQGPVLSVQLGRPGISSRAAVSTAAVPTCSARPHTDTMQAVAGAETQVAAPEICSWLCRRRRLRCAQGGPLPGQPPDSARLRPASPGPKRQADTPEQSWCRSTPASFSYLPARKGRQTRPGQCGAGQHRSAEIT